MRATAAAALGIAVATVGCVRAPSPLEPGLEGSIGLPYRGCLTDGIELPDSGPGYRFLRHDGRHFAGPRFAATLERAAAGVANERPGGTLVIGDLSAKHGGRLLPHLSHRSGHDADLVLYATTLEGTPVVAPGFIHYGPDGLAWDETGQRWLRLDVEREWLLVRALLEDPDARVEWMFANHLVEALLLEWALARGEPADLVLRAQLVLLEPHPGGAHDDHLHVRTACSVEEEARGCETGGPVRPWLGGAIASDGPTDEELVAVLLGTPRTGGH